MAVSEAEQYVLNSNNEFTKDLYKVLTKDKKDNVFFSPLSLHAVLAMAQYATGGTTREAFVKTLRIEDENQSAEGYRALLKSAQDVQDVTLLIANKAFVAKDFELCSSFEEVVAEKFLSEVGSVDFTNAAAAADTINEWVNEKTKEKIPTLFNKDDLGSDTAVILANAIYFKGNWKEQFDRECTYTEPFFVTEKKKIDCQMMHYSEMNVPFKIDKELGAKVAILPYREKDFGMAVILPIKKNTLADVEAKLADMSFTDVLKDLSEMEVDISLPKFKIEATMELNEPLTELGLGVMFGNQCDLSRMLSGGPPLRVSKVVQKAFIEVNEEGAEAAAATGMGSEFFAAGIRPKVYANHPFLIIIGAFSSELTKTIFCGKIVNPVSGDSEVGPVDDDPCDFDEYVDFEDGDL